MTHVQVPTEFTSPTGNVPLYSDSIGYCQSYDFSLANISEESRIAAISTIASVCYNSPKALGSISLYNRLATESAGLPSSSFEFVPVLLKPYHIASAPFRSCHKYGELITHNNSTYLLTNLRALMADVGDRANEYFNTPEECAIIAKHFKVFKWHIPLFVARQAMRHRCSWQELSRRYVSGKKMDFDFYIPSKLADVCIDLYSGTVQGQDAYAEIDWEELHSCALQLYNQAIDQGIKPELARTILPQSMYTTIWSAWLPYQLESFFKLRLDKHAQYEIRELAASMKYLLTDTSAEGVTYNSFKESVLN